MLLNTVILVINGSLTALAGRIFLTDGCGVIRGIWTTSLPLGLKKAKVLLSPSWSRLDWLSFVWLGFVVGQAGLYQGIAMFLVAYFIICMTVLSVCAISTNGALDAGGAYCILFTRMYSRSSVVRLLLQPSCVFPIFTHQLNLFLRPTRSRPVVNAATIVV